MIARRSTRFASSRTLPGQSWRQSDMIAAELKRIDPRFSCSIREISSLSSRAMSSTRSRSGAISMGNTLRR
ncbi:Uncharacterised protein [Klebsiella pneumoniae]|nr:Uncharacterised protein [Klebsiella pneumoniae]